MSDPTTIIAGRDGAPSLAIDVQPDGAGDSFVLDDSELDGDALLGWPNPLDGEWLNIVCDVTRVNVRRGASRMIGPLTRSEAGIATVELLDADRRFDPLINADAIHAGTPIRVRAWGVDPAPWSAVLFTASLEDVPVTYARTGPPRVTLTASDVIADLASWSSVGRPDPGVGAGDDLLERVERVIAETGLPIEVSLDSDDAFTATLAASSLGGGWDDINAATDAELGRVWVDASNRLVVRARESELSGPVRGTLSDWHGEAPTAPHACYDELDATLGTELITNRVIAARRVPASGDAANPAGSAVVQVDDGESQARYRRVRALDRRDLELETDGQLAPWANALLVATSHPELRIDRTTPAPWGAGPEAWQAVCSTDIGDRWLLRYHPELGPTVARTVGVLGIEHDISPDSWAIVWQLADAPTPGDENPAGWFLLDYSELDGDDLLVPVSAVVEQEGAPATDGTIILDGGGPSSWQ